MAKAFKKGDEVTYVSDWDRKGTAYYRQAIVYSCGTKQMVLTDAETGEEMGRHFRPVVGDLVGTFPRMTEAEAIEKCLAAGAAIVAKEAARYNHCLTLGQSEGYNNAVRKDLAKLHEPRAVSYKEAQELIQRALAA